MIITAGVMRWRAVAAEQVGRSVILKHGMVSGER